MRSMRTRRVAQFAGAVSVAAVALTGCSAGQVAETALKNTSTYGVNADNADASVVLRGLAVAYGSTKGYPAGGNAPLELSLFNQTTQPVTVRIASQPLAGTDAKAGVQSAQAVGIVGGTPSAVPSTIPGDVEPSGSRAPARPQLSHVERGWSADRRCQCRPVRGGPAGRRTHPGRAGRPSRRDHHRAAEHGGVPPGWRGAAAGHRPFGSAAAGHLGESGLLVQHRRRAARRAGSGRCAAVARTARIGAERGRG